MSGIDHLCDHDAAITRKSAPGGTVDAVRFPTAAYAAVSNPSPLRCRPTKAKERARTASGHEVIGDWVLYFPAGVDVAKGDRIAVSGVGTFDVEFADIRPGGTPHHIEVDAKLVEF